MEEGSAVGYVGLQGVQDDMFSRAWSTDFVLSSHYVQPPPTMDGVRSGTSRSQTCACPGGPRRRGGDRSGVVT